MVLDIHPLNIRFEINLIDYELHPMFFNLACELAFIHLKIYRPILVNDLKINWHDQLKGFNM
jgi:hypothetical protein